ncbi:MAG: thiamine phosphate synthase [Myxococcales bacterium]|nr:thiamine phosphate synthase [Myxococcales bacterium]
MPPALPDLLLITDPAWGDEMVPRIDAALAVAGLGRVGVQLRAKGAPGEPRSDRARLALGRELRAITSRWGAPLLINGRVDLAAILGAEGVHLPESGIEVGEARRLLPGARWIGRSCHDAEGLRAASAEGADYATLGPFGPVPGKGSPLGPAGFEALASGCSLPLYALGGLGVAEIGAALEAGARGVAMIRGLACSADPAAALRAILAEIDRARASGTDAPPRRT